MAYEGWEDDRILPWEKVAEEIGKNLDFINSEDMFEWFLDNETRMNWQEFGHWAEEYEAVPGYEWINEVFDDGYDRFAITKLIW